MPRKTPRSRVRTRPSNVILNNAHTELATLLEILSTRVFRVHSRFCLTCTRVTHSNARFGVRNQQCLNRVVFHRTARNSEYYPFKVRDRDDTGHSRGEPQRWQHLRMLPPMAFTVPSVPKVATRHRPRSRGSAPCFRAYVPKYIGWTMSSTGLCLVMWDATRGERAIAG